jgi:hypothetical protein
MMGALTCDVAFCLSFFLPSDEASSSELGRAPPQQVLLEGSRTRAEGPQVV